MLRLTFLVFFTCFFLFRPYQLQNPGMLYGGDDPSYFAYSTALVYGRFPSFEKEFVEEFEVPPLSRIGPGLMAAPFVGIFSVVDRWTGNPIVEKRTRENVRDSWSLYGAVFSAAFYFWLACVLLYLALTRYFSDRVTLWSIGLMVVCQGVGLYAFLRPVFSHIYEFVIQCAFLYLFVRQSKTPPPPENRNSPALILGVAALSTLALMVRQNALFYALLWPVLILGARDSVTLPFRRWKSIGVSIGLGFVTYWVLKYIPFWMAPERYAAVNASFETSAFMFKFESPYFYVKRLWTVLFGLDWGLIWTAPFLLMGLCGLFFRQLPLRRQLRLLALPLLVNLYILIIWKGQGGWYGYRYLLFSAVPILILPFAVLIQTLRERRIWLFRAILVWAFFPTISMLLFDATPKTVLDVVITEFGERNWGNLTYQIEVWKQFFGHPFQSLYYICKTGPSFVVYVLVNSLDALERWRGLFTKAYPSFEIRIIVQTLLLYALPWGLYVIWKKHSAKAS